MLEVYYYIVLVFIILLYEQLVLQLQLYYS